MRNMLAIKALQCSTCAQQIADEHRLVVTQYSKSSLVLFRNIRDSRLPVMVGNFSMQIMGGINGV